MSSVVEQEYVKLNKILESGTPVTISMNGHEVVAPVYGKVQRDTEKSVWLYGRDMVILTPHGNEDEWKNIIEIEVRGSQFLSSLNMMSINNRYVLVNGLPVYACTSFHSLSMSGIYIVGLNKYELSAVDALFIDNVESWRNHILPNINVDTVSTLIRTLMSDFFKLMVQGKVGPHSAHAEISIAIVKMFEPNLFTPYRLRYFGFDFCNPSGVDLHSSTDTNIVDFTNRETRKYFNSIIQRVMFAVGYWSRRVAATEEGEYYESYEVPVGQDLYDLSDCVWIVCEEFMDGVARSRPA